MFKIVVMASSITVMVRVSVLIFTSPTCIWHPSWAWPHWNFAEILAVMWQSQ